MRETRKYARSSVARRAIGVLPTAGHILAACLLAGLPALPLAAEPAKAPVAKAALTVTATAATNEDWSHTLPGNGNVAAWQEAVIGAEVSGYRIAEVKVGVGDSVKKGQVLARIADEMVRSEREEARAAVAEAEAQLADAKANADRARTLREKGFYSPQSSSQFVTAEQTAKARAASAKARLQGAEIRLSKMQIVAPDSGVISARAATVGSLTQPGQELFRLIRGGRLEWRAEVSGDELAKLKPGMPVQVSGTNGQAVKGRVRIVAPTIDPQSRNGFVYVDIDAAAAAAAGLRAGSFVRGVFELGRSPALALPQTAVVLREGFAYVYRIDAANKVIQTKVATGRRSGDRIEITGGLEAGARVVASGAAFLADGDTVKLVEGK